MRLFISIEFTDEIKAALAKVSQELKEKAGSGLFVPPETMHLTLVFLGETRQGKVALNVLSRLETEPFELTLGSIGRFPRSSGDLYWVGIQESPELTQLHTRLRRELNRVGFLLEQRRFIPHVTLARQIHASGEIPLTLPALSMPVKRISLIRSDRTENGMVYSEIFGKDL